MTPGIWKHAGEPPWSINWPWFMRMFMEYTPGEDFEKQIEEHRGMHGTECALVECQYEHPDFNALNKEQLDFYLYYRDCFFRREAIDTDVGYAWLLMVELINSRDDPEKTLRDLIRLYDSCHGEVLRYWMRQDATEAVFSYAAANGLDLPRVSPGREGIWRGVLISEILLPEPEHVSDEMIDLLTAEECCRYNALNRGKDLLGRLFNAVLPAVDAEMKKTTGKGILETYGEKRTDPIVLFSMRGRRSGLTPYFYDRDCTVTYTAPNDHLETFLVAMARYCEQAIVKETKGSKGPVAGNIFTKEHRRMVDGIFNHGDIIEPQHQPNTGRGSVRGFCIGDADCPMVIDSTGFSDEAPPSNFLSSMVKYAAKEPSKECMYVRSGFRKPSYRSLSPDALDYYLWWRGRAREGRYGATDEGYLWLYKCELINAYEDRDYVMEQLAGLAKAYDGYFRVDSEGQTGKPGMTYLDYALVNSCVPDPTVYVCPLTASYMIERLLKGETDVPVSAAAMVVASGIGRKSADVQILAAFDDDCAHIAARALVRVNKILESYGLDVFRFACVYSTCVRLEVLRGLRYHHWPDGKRRNQECRYIDIFDGHEFMDEMRALIKAVISAVDDRGKPQRKKKPQAAFDVELDGILQEEVEEWFNEKERKAATERAMSLTIDRSEVERAQADLDHVTSIMSMEEAVEIEEYAAVEPETDAAEPDDPWQAFAARLDKGQRDYLKKALAGTLRSVKPMIEDSINAVAMDTVKDTVLENGEVFDEYAEDVRKAPDFDDDRDP